MKENNKKYWKGLEELNNNPEFLVNSQNEFPEFLPVKEQKGTESEGTDRRDFLKLLGFGVAAVSLAACEAPVNKAIPYLNKPVDVEPGVANWYASTYVDGGEYVSVLVKTREGRPIKIEGNKLSKITKGGTNARAQASVLTLYDNTRLTSFTKNGKAESKEKVDAEILSKLQGLNGGAIRIVSSTILSPTTKKLIAEFGAKYGNTQHVVYDASSASGLLKANQASFGKAIIPSYDFSKANVIVSFGADFLGTWISPVEYATQYGSRKKLGKSKRSKDAYEIVKHYQFETNLSLTGCNADVRTPIKPSEEGAYVADLYNALKGGSAKYPVVKQAAAELNANKGKSLVVSGSNDVNVQLVVNEINKMLNNVGTSVDTDTPSFQKQGDDAKMAAFIEEVKGGKVAAVIFYNANPVYDHPMGKELGEALKKVSLSISFADRLDETSSKVTYVCPDLHYLESWNDAEAKRGSYSLIQPTISPIFKDLRQAQDSLLVWSGNKTDYYSYLTNNWKQNILKGASWEKVLHDGVYETATSASELLPSTEGEGGSADVASAVAAISSAKSSGKELVLYEKVGVGSGSQANNPWLQELPDPVSKATWGNYIAVPISFVKDKDSKSAKYKDGDVFSLSVNGKEVFKLPILVQPGQAPDTFAVAIGYGRTAAGKTANGVGENAFPLASLKGGAISYTVSNVDLKPTGDFSEIAQTQTHQTIMGRAIIQDAVLSEYQTNPEAGRFKPMIQTPDGPKPPKDITVWYEHEKPNHLWGMVIDLNSCIGCGSCVIGCQSENNIPVVGKKEVINRREMHWLRIDRYYSSPESVTTKKEFGNEGKYFKGDSQNWENPEDNPEVTFQPMLCQQCNHAPCETVCPVAATTHSSEGLNQMAYNRCIGTRYCANNCPYKVRRFNWFKYFDNGEKFPENTSMNTTLGKMVLNPDVTVRSRGVMEKCTFCVQRIQDVKLTAKRENRRPVDGEVVTACASACPTNAIMFGDLNDPKSKVFHELSEENKERAYTVLEEINTRPNIAYLTRIRNKQA
jgi:molybdopterin-containing oxidoreductase family iron-sulfur binding subunit